MRTPRGRSAPTDTSTATLRADGTLALNWLAWSSLGRPGFVELLFDESKRLIGLRKVSADHEPRRRYKVSTQGQHYTVSLVALCRRYGIEHPEARRYKLSGYMQSDEGDIRYFDLKSEYEVIAGTNRPHKKEGANR